ncbi:CPBP family intramembrane glutamic endopeptidase [Corynebacterium sp. H130]|uniref:CPBP family intramembrane glutamic endopeptidase n=1 Tax=Corynebacterium sp. H130 TaxID=3133444 RepID=UPI0030983948
MLVSTSLDPGAQPQDSSLESAAATGLVPAWALALGLLSFTVIGPILEEIVFRGVLMHELGKLVRPVWVVVLSAAIFMAIHLAVPVFPFLFVMGVFLAWMRLWHGSLWPPVLAHMCGNTIASFGVVLALV